jgi:hypothetical protein
MHLAEHTPQIADADIVVEDVPIVGRRIHRAPLGRVIRQTSPTQLVLHRRPIEQAGGEVSLLRDVLAELAAEWLGCEPTAVDPHYPRS